MPLFALTVGAGTARIGKFLHRLFLLLDRFDQFELRPATVKIMTGPMDAEISVAR